nr:hypothetical protein GCM10020063_044600 [Dactylosporangium thailandense]
MNRRAAAAVRRTAARARLGETMTHDERYADLVRTTLAGLTGGPRAEDDQPLRDHGLSSLLAVRLVLELGARLGADVPIEWITGGTTIRGLAGRLAALAPGYDPSRDRGDDQPVGPAADDGLPLTPIQQAYLIGADPDLGTDPVGCQLYREFTVAGLDPDAAVAAWHRVVAAHDALRLRVGDDWRQRVAPAATPAVVPVHDLSAAGPAEFAAHLGRVRARLTARTFGPGGEDRWALEVSRGPGDAGVLHLVIDGLIIDGRGLDLVLAHWWQAYGEPGHDFGGGALTLERCLRTLAADTGTREADLAYWRDRLPAVLRAPAVLGGEPPAGPLPRGVLQAALTPAQWRRLREHAAALDVSPTALVLTVFTDTLTRHGARDPYALVLTASDRMRLPAAADAVPGPFTSTVVFAVEPASGPFEETAAALHAALWRDLGHARISGVEALRDRHAGGDGPLPVVFTSLLDLPTADVRTSFAAYTTHRSSRTSGVALDHQMWEQDGALRIHWDVAPARFAAGTPQTLLASFTNALRALAAHDAARDEQRPLNELQKAYFVPRVSGPAPWDGCQVYHSFTVDDLDLARLEAAWQRMIEAHDVLRSRLCYDGTLRVRARAGDGWHIPVIELDPGTEAAELARIRDEMAGTAFPLDRWPQFDLRVTRTAGDGDPRWVVHCGIDLTIADGISIHRMLRELFRLAADPAAAPRVAQPWAALERHRAAAYPPPARDAARAYWRERFAGMPPGPRLAQDPDRHRQRRTGRLTGWRALRERAEAEGYGADPLLLAILVQALATVFDEDFALPAVRWTPHDEPYRPGEHTGLSWIARGPRALPVAERAALIRRQYVRDAAGDAVSGLEELRRVVMAQRRGGDYGFPIVYTGLLELTEERLPDGVAAGPWMTYTPDVSLDCIAAEDGDELVYFWDAVPGDFPPGALDEAFASYERLLREPFAAEPTPDAPSPAWNDTAVAHPPPEPAHLRFERQAQARPHEVALRYRGGTTTFGELDRRANGIAARLRALGAGPGTFVAIRARRGPGMIAAVLGVAKTGAAYVPVDPALPEARAHVMLADAAARIVLSSGGAAQWEPPAGTAVVDADAVPGADAGPEWRGTPDDPAYVIFTSGSTGTPKGVLVAHRALDNLLHWAARAYPTGPGDVGLQVTSLGFDLSVYDIFGLLGSGAGLYVADAEQQKDPALLLDVLLTEPVTFWNSAPTTLAQLMPLLPGPEPAHPGTGTLRLVFLSGDYTPLTLPDALRAVFTRARVISLGGATEATVWSNHFPIEDVDPAWRSIPYGRPIDNCRYYILDEARRPCPVGVEGDLYIAGVCLAEGYVNRPDLTAERFVEDPFASPAGQRMYATGDRAAYRPDGVIVFLGRADTQVKIRGFRVEPGEIEHCLRRHPAVADAVVVPRPDPAGDRKLVAYIVPAGPLPPTRELRAFAAQTLPDYMVPNAVVAVPAFPATANGKLDRDALPWPPPPSPIVDGAVIAPVAAALPPAPVPAPVPAPASVVEPAADGRLTEELAAILAGLLGQASVDTEQDLWDQGATSFTMVQVAAEMRRRYDRRVPVNVLLAEPTVAAMAGHLASTGARPVSPAPAPAAAAPVPVAAPSSPVPSAEPPAPVAPPTPPEVPSPSSVDVFSADEQAAFKAAGWGQRPAGPDDVLVPLSAAAPAAEHFRWRGTRRTFAAGPVPRAAFDGLLGLLGAEPGDGQRRLYPSAGDTYAVQVYVRVRPDAVQGVPAGLYYLRAQERALQLVNPAPDIPRGIHFFYNRPVFDTASFEVYLIGQSRGIEPVYGPDADGYLRLEAGYLGELLMLGQAAFGLGLCPIGGLAFDRIRAQFALDDGHRFLHAFLGGPAGHDPATAGAVPAFAPPAVPTVPAVPPASVVSAVRDVPAVRDVAIVGLSGRYPDAPDLDRLWRNLAAGRRSVAPPPPARAGDVGSALPGAYLDDIDRFDSLLFHIAPAEARELDPQLRLALEVAWECLENAGYTPEGLRAAAPRVGVYAAVMWQDYQHVGAAGWTDGGAARVSGVAADIPSRISHCLGLRGPSIAVNTSCSSSLTALHLAATALRSAECDAALVVAVNLIAHPYHAAVLRGLDLVSTSGVAGAFDAAAGGWSPGEGAGAVLLRPDAAAVGDGDHRWGVLEATWAGHAGGGNRFLAPNVAALTRSLRETLAAAGREPADIGYVECAAGGSGIADAAEIQALDAVLGGRGGTVPIGTVKANIGHLEAASGLAQLTKVLLQFHHERLAPTPRADELSPLVDWDAVALRVVDAPAPWPPPDATAPRRVLVNALGATGSYGHLVLRAPDPLAVAPAADGPLVVPLSAQTPDQVREAARRVRAALDGGAVPSADIAYTLQVGRVTMAHRVAFPAADPASLRAALDAFLATGHVEAPADVLTRSWLAGEPVDWAAAWRVPGRRVPLPTYPFAPDRHRLAVEPAPAPADEPGDLERYLCAMFAEVSQIPAGRIDAHTPLEHYGLTSLMVTGLNARLAERFDGVPRTLFYEHRDLAGIAAALTRTAAPRTAAEAPLARTRDTEEPIAVIGVAGRYPQAADLDEFWRNLVAGRDCVTAPPPGRPGPDDDAAIGGFLDDVDLFDPMLFQITPRDATLMDPQERLFLETVWRVLEDAGYSRARLRMRHGGRVGVFAGTMYNEYPFFGVERSAAGAPIATGSAIAGIANRVSWFLDAAGPSLTVDTMCSSSLTALHLAAESLRRDECEVAVAGGVNLSLHRNKFVQQRAMGMTAAGGRCRPFGAGGDGLVPGEGVGAVLLKTLARAQADGDRIHGVILATAVNHGGRTSGYLVPNPVAQAELVASVLRRAGLDPSGVGYVEAHGTGTALGDPIELSGLQRAYGDRPAGSVPIGSVKSNIGHLEGAAGIAGLTKILLQLRHGELVPSLHADRLNPNVDWAASPFAVQRAVAPWPRGATARRAALSSFGAGGSNAHALVEEAPPPVAPSPVPGPQLVVVSAANPEQLAAVAARLAGHLADHPGLDLAGVAHTLRAGREALAHRAAFVAADLAEARRRLAALAAGDHTGIVLGRRSGPAGSGPTVADPERLDLDELARQWTAGAEVDWDRLGRAGLVALPGHPFARMRCWLPDADPPAPGRGHEIEAESAAVPLTARRWEPDEAPFPDASPFPGAVLCLIGGADGTDLAARVAAALPATRFVLARTAAGAGDDLPVVDSEAAGLALLDAHPGLTGWLDLSDVDGPAAGDPRPHTWRPRLTMLQRLLRGPRPVARILHVTRGVQPAGGPPPRLAGGPPPRLAGAVMTALVRSIAAEHAAVRATALDCDEADPARIASEFTAGAGAEVCHRSGRRLLPLAVAAPARPLPPARLRADRAYVVTGGTRGLGALAARRLAERGARRIALFSATPVSGDTQAALATIRALEAEGVTVHASAPDLTDPADLAAALERVRADLGPIGGLVHCAGRAAAPGPLVLRDPGAVAAVLAPKTEGATNLAELCAADPLEFAVLYSSVSAAVPALAAGVADYAAANAYLDLLAGYQARLGRTAYRSIQWTVWRESGSGAGAAAACARAGLGTLTDREGLDVLDLALAGATQTVVQTAPAVPGPVDTVAATEPPAAAGPVPGWLADLFVATAGIPAQALDPDAEFRDLGVESVMLAELVRRIEEHVAQPVPPSLLLEHPTLRLLAAALPAPDPAPTAEPRAATPAPAGKVAVIGLACRMPGAADADAFWDNLVAGRSAVTEVPPGRWSAAELYPGRSVSKWGGFVDGIEDFDAGWFGIGEEEAVCLDPGIRLFLESSVAALRDAGYRDDEVRGRDVAVFAGARLSGYRHRAGVRGGAAGLGADQNFIAARVADALDLHGPNLVVDSACSSALVAVGLACRSLLSGESELALAGGVEILLDEEPYLQFTAARALSPSGRCATFDADADGFVPGEGCGVLVLKELGAAIRDGDRIRAVIDAVAVNNDGRTMGLTTPNPVAQAAVVRRAIAASGYGAGDIGLLEAHGTGTMIGDPIELRALTQVYRESTSDTGYCGLGSVKTNVGHLLSAAGIAGLLKVVLAVERGVRPPTLHCHRPNPRFDFAASPFTPQLAAEPWAGRRVAGVSAFGLGGTNAHAIVSAPDDHVAAGVRRTALPAPGFQRRRYWLERAAAPAPEPAPAPPEPVAVPPLPASVSSLLDLRFVRTTRVNGRTPS